MACIGELLNHNGAKARWHDIKSGNARFIQKLNDCPLKGSARKKTRRSPLWHLAILAAQTAPPLPKKGVAADKARSRHGQVKVRGNRTETAVAKSLKG
jgi:hypothetical protein